MIRSLTQMMIAAVLCVATLPIAACTTAPGAGPALTSPAPATPLDRAERAYARFRASAELVMAIVPEPYATRVRAGLDYADRAIAAARIADDVAEQLRQLRKVDAAVAAIAAIAPVVEQAVPKE